MKATLELPDEFMHRVKIRAFMQGKKPDDLLAEITIAAFDVILPEKTLRIVEPDDGSLPYFECDPSSRRTPTFEELQRIAEESQMEEDLQHLGISI